MPPIDPISNPVSHWQQDFITAIRSGKIQAAKTAIYLRLKAKSQRPPGVAERIALNEAITLLRALSGGPILHHSMSSADRRENKMDEDTQRTENDRPEE